jgi:hypothetical protein
VRSIVEHWLEPGTFDQPIGVRVVRSDHHGGVLEDSAVAHLPDDLEYMEQQRAAVKWGVQLATPEP